MLTTYFFCANNTTYFSYGWFSMSVCAVKSEGQLCPIKLCAPTDGTAQVALARLRRLKRRPCSEGTVVPFWDTAFGASNRNAARRFDQCFDFVESASRRTRRRWEDNSQ